MPSTAKQRRFERRHPQRVIASKATDAKGPLLSFEPMGASRSGPVLRFDAKGCPHEGGFRVILDARANPIRAICKDCTAEWRMVR